MMSIHQMNTIGLKPPEDTLARQSDVEVTTNVSLYGEYKGFFIHVISSLVLICFILWTLIPERIFEILQFDYFPDKYWSIAIPAYSLMLMLYIYVALALYNTEVKTFKLDDVRTMIDEHSFYPGDKLEGEQRDEELVKYVHDAPSGVWELPVSLVNEVLYSGGGEGESEGDIESEIEYESSLDSLD